VSGALQRCFLHGEPSPARVDEPREEDTLTGKETAARDAQGVEASEDRLGPFEWFLSGKVFITGNSTSTVTFYTNHPGIWQGLFLLAPQRGCRGDFYGERLFGVGIQQQAKINLTTRHSTH